MRHQADPINPPKCQVGAIFHQDDHNDCNSSSYHLCDECVPSITLGRTVHIIGWKVTVKCPEEGVLFSSSLTKALYKLVTASSSNELELGVYLGKGS